MYDSSHSHAHAQKVQKAPRPLAEAIVLGVLAIGADILLAIFTGYVFHLYWFWFFVPLGVPAIGIAHAIGIRYLVYTFNSPFKAESLDMEKREGFEKVFYKIFVLSIMMLFFWGIGYIIHSFM